MNNKKKNKKNNQNKKIVIEYYARGNVGTTDVVSDELKSLANKIKEIYENESFEKVKEFCENLESWYGWDIEIDNDNKSILVINNKLDKYGNSWGAESAEIKESKIFKQIEEAKKEALEFLEKNKDKKFMITYNDIGDYAVGNAYKFLDEDKKYYTIDDIREFAIEFFDYLEYDFKDIGTPEERAIAICCNNPYAYDKPGFEVEVSEKSLMFKTRYQDLLGACYHTLNEKIVFEIVN